MSTQLLGHVGKRIRLYRKARNITLEQLAVRIGKSKATVSKYEAGGISIDLATLFDVAAVLEVEPLKLLDFPLPGQTPRPPKNPLDSDRLYMYHMYGGHLYQSVITLRENPVTAVTEATLFYRAEDLDDFERCECLYHGEIRSHEAVFCFTLQNYYNSVENLLINFLIPMKKISYLVGMMSGLHNATFLPVGCKAVLSGSPMKTDDFLRDLLTISKDTFKEMKSRNLLLIGE